MVWRTPFLNGTFKNMVTFKSIDVSALYLTLAYPRKAFLVMALTLNVMSIAIMAVLLLGFLIMAFTIMASTIMAVISTFSLLGNDPCLDASWPNFITGFP